MSHTHLVFEPYTRRPVSLVYIAHVNFKVHCHMTVKNDIILNSNIYHIRPLKAALIYEEMYKNETRNE